ncbi:hypothetical protein GQ55_9G399100 [Panicum hallii var. hallii]|uniref:Uncharacterized protein n=1 Tax=Panicum hallii var. hallii TaxID=1504633 RepID=A0A2T7C9V9_9POAL|nr:hypothetical protein GQ55_9G399100 [Panicum hallii var. hallii]
MDTVRFRSTTIRFYRTLELPSVAVETFGASVPPAPLAAASAEAGDRSEAVVSSHDPDIHAKAKYIEDGLILFGDHLWTIHGLWSELLANLWM